MSKQSRHLVPLTRRFLHLFIMQLLPLLSKVRAVRWRGGRNNSVWLIQIKSFLTALCIFHGEALQKLTLPAIIIDCHKKQKELGQKKKKDMMAQQPGLPKKKVNRRWEDLGPMSPMSMATSTWQKFPPFSFFLLFGGFCIITTLTETTGNPTPPPRSFNRRLIVTNALWYTRFSHNLAEEFKQKLWGRWMDKWADVHGPWAMSLELTWQIAQKSWYK